MSDVFAADADETAFFEQAGSAPEAQTETATEPDPVEPDGGEEATEDKPKPQFELTEDGHPRGYVRQEALREERQRRREYEARMEERLQRLTEAMQPKEEKPEPPSIDDDPVGHLAAQIREMQAASQQTQEQVRAQQEQAWLRNHADTSAAEFSQRQPDYPDAVGFLKESIAREVRALDPNADVERYINQKSEELVRMSAQRGGGFAQMVYDLATARGYTPKQAEAKATEAEQKLEAMERGTKAATRGRGDAPTKGPSIKDLEAMSEEEFDKAVANGDFKRIFGG